MRISTSASVAAERSPRSRASCRCATKALHTPHPSAGFGGRFGNDRYIGPDIVVCALLTPYASPLAQSVESMVQPLISGI
ncbi:hypothetical protein ACIOGX_13845 [Streptomyces sp. NPDC088147]|uniref:hypothetical protein n=1 Tax=unclassified Streptomyces TaxID=2593676 RepID=UPI0037F9F793